MTTSPSNERTDSSPFRRAPRSALLGLFLLLAAVFCLTNSGTVNAVDARPVIAEAASLVDAGSVRYDRLDPVTYERDFRVWAKCVPVPGRPGEPPGQRNKYGFALHLAYVPAYFAARVVAGALHAPRMGVAIFTTSFVNPLAGALCGALLLAILCRLGYGARLSIGVVAVCFLGSFFWPLTAISYSDPLQTMFLLAVLLQALRCRDDDRASQLHLLGLLCLVAVSAKLVNVVLVAPLAATAVTGRPTWRRSLLPAAVWSLALVAAVGAVNWARFGDPTNTGYPPSEQFRSGLLDGLVLLFASYWKGLVWFFPLLPLGVWGLARVVRSRPWFGVPVVAGMAAQACMYASFHDAHGGWCWGPRYLLAWTPLCAIGVADALSSNAPRTRTAVLWTAFVATSAWTLPSVLVQYFLEQYVRDAVVDAGGTWRSEPAPVTAFRLLREKTVTGPDSVRLASFSPGLSSDAVVRFDSWDNGGWQTWWVKPHERFPAWLRFGSAAGLVVVGTIGVALLRADASRERVKPS